MDKKEKPADVATVNEQEAELQELQEKQQKLTTNYTMSGKKLKAQFCKRIGKNLKKYRKMRGISQYRAAELLQFSGSMYNAYENGKLMPKLDRLIAMAEFYQASLDDLVGIKSKPEEELEVLEAEDSDSVTVAVIPVAIAAIVTALVTVTVMSFV